MLEGKFGARYGEINLAWFWARIYKRTKQLGYYRGGFQALVEALASGVLRRGVRIHTEAPVQRITQLAESGFRVESNGSTQNFDVVISTTSRRAWRKLRLACRATTLPSSPACKAWAPSC